MSDSVKGKIDTIDLDMSLDDIADLPVFLALPTGAYMVLLEHGIEEKDINDHKALQMAMTVQEVLECDEDKLDEGEELPKVGDIATQAFMLDNEFGVGLLKQTIKPMSLSFGTKTVRETILASKGVQLMVVIKRRKGKKGTENEDKNFMSFVRVEVV